MKQFLSFLVTLVFIIGPSASALAQQSVPFEPSKKAWKSADKQLKKMTLEEKVGQLIHIGINARYYNQDNSAFQELKRQVVEDKVGGIILFAGPIYESVHLVNRMQENAKIPLLIGMDAETGVGMRFSDSVNFPWNMAVAAAGDPELARKMGEITGREARAIGVHQVYAPVLDVNNNAENPVINVRSFSENPEDVARFGAAFIQGVQSQNVIATAKHFPGHGDTNIDSHRGLPVINLSRERLDKIELVPFKRAVEAGVASVMIAHISLPQIDPTEIKPLKQAIKPIDTTEGEQIITEKTTVPSTLSAIVNQQILRKDLGFRGLIVTDAMSMAGLTLYVNQDEAAVRAFLAGADILLKPAETKAPILGLMDAVKSGRITEDRLNESVRKILAWKYQLGLFKDKITPLEEIDTIVSNRESHKVAEQIANKAVTLVKDDKNYLPIDRSKKIFLLTATNGDDGAFTAYPFKRVLTENNIKFTESVLDNRATEAEINLALKRANEADVVVAALFGRVRSGQSTSIGLPNGGIRVLRGIMNTDKPLVNISFGNPYTLRDFPKMDNYIVAYGDMTALQRAAAFAVLGMQSFSGKLPIQISSKYPVGTGLALR